LRLPADSLRLAALSAIYTTVAIRVIFHFASWQIRFCIVLLSLRGQTIYTTVLTGATGLRNHMKSRHRYITHSLLKHCDPRARCISILISELTADCVRLAVAVSALWMQYSLFDGQMSMSFSCTQWRPLVRGCMLISFLAEHSPLNQGDIGSPVHRPLRIWNKSVDFIWNKSRKERFQNHHNLFHFSCARIFAEVQCLSCRQPALKESKS
jgi:hypothetical protein